MILQPLSPEDWNLFLRLAQGESWQVPLKEQLLFQHQWRPYFLALRHAGRTCGFISVVSYRHSGWIGNLLVDPELRGRGYGTFLFKEALTLLQQRPRQRIWLTASVPGQALYAGYGFVPIDTVLRWSATGQGHGKHRAAAATGECLASLDEDCWGEDRRDLLRVIATDACLLQQTNTLALLQTGMDMWQLGPWSATRTDPCQARRLLATARAITPADKRLFVDVLHSAGIELMLRQAGFVRHGHNRLMFRGEAPRLRGVIALASCGSIG